MHYSISQHCWYCYFKYTCIVFAWCPCSKQCASIWHLTVAWFTLTEAASVSLTKSRNSCDGTLCLAFFSVGDFPCFGALKHLHVEGRRHGSVTLVKRDASASNHTHPRKLHLGRRVIPIEEHTLFFKKLHLSLFIASSKFPTEKKWIWIQRRINSVFRETGACLVVAVV